MPNQNRLFDDLARVAGGALGALSGVREEIELLIRGRVERVLADIELVPREEFDVVKAMAAQARSENEALLARLDALEERLKAKSAAGTPARRPQGRRSVPPTALGADSSIPPDDDQESLYAAEDGDTGAEAGAEDSKA